MTCFMSVLRYRVAVSKSLLPRDAYFLTVSFFLCFVVLFFVVTIEARATSLFEFRLGK